MKTKSVTEFIAVSTIKYKWGIGVEELRVSTTDIKAAETEIKEIVDNFNKTLRPNEHPREFINVTEVKTVTQQIKDYSDEEE